MRCIFLLGLFPLVSNRPAACSDDILGGKRDSAGAHACATRGHRVSHDRVGKQAITLLCLLVCLLIGCCHRCMAINNFQTLMEILVGLSMGPVSRLTQTWDAVRCFAIKFACSF